MQKQMVITTRAQVKSNIEVHGIAWTANWLRKRKVPFSIAYWMAFGTAPRFSSMMPSTDGPAARFYHVLYERLVARGY